jgi:hypothetical protein
MRFDARNRPDLQRSPQSGIKSNANFAVLAGTVPVALAASGRIPAYLRIAWQDFVDYSANGRCSGDMVQFVARFLADAATLVDYP